MRSIEYADIPCLAGKGITFCRPERSLGQSGWILYKRKQQLFLAKSLLNACDDCVIVKVCICDRNKKILCNEMI